MLDNTSAPGFRGYKQPGFPKEGWKVEDGVLKSVPGGKGGDIVTTEQFGDFELVLEFKLTPKANSGIIYRVAETDGPTYQTGPEFQVIDDAGNNLKPGDPNSTGALYDLATPSDKKVMKPTGEWNTARVLLRDGVVQHWVNGAKVVECLMGGEDWTARIGKSKFKDFKSFGVLPKGHIALQDHGNEVWYRHIKVRDLGAPLSNEVRLFNGRDLTGWVAIVPDAAKQNIKPESVWSVVQEGPSAVLVCSGNPAGYIRTLKDYKNYVLVLEWRFSPVTKKAGNSGVLLRMVGEDKVWPNSVEAQLHSGNAGDFWNIGDFKMTADPARTNGRNTKKTHAAERPIGEWNRYEIIVHKGDVILFVNGEELNRATSVDEIAGKIGLQSEGAEIHFRDIRLAPLD